MTVLVMGGAGSADGHQALAPLDPGYEEIVVLDNLSTGFDWEVPEGTQPAVSEDEPNARDRT